MVDHFGVERLIDQETPSAALALKIPGPMFALAMMLIGMLSFVHRTQPRARAVLLAIAGVSFPMARIPAVAGVAVVSDLALLAAMVPVFWSTRSSQDAA
ncbi:hypothetical protein ACE2AJ_09435 [Aquihabitans daechungensis]|uniref:hypothetical protein n=1 Tax=Aquihabitans daechungensis TaxID=1052257 RepID=UPI003BA38190